MPPADLSFSVLLPFAVTCLVIELTPGPNMAYLAVVSATEGRRAGFAATAGVALGLGVVGFASGLGLAALIAQSPPLYQSLRWGGILYLLWLAWEGWSESAEAAPGRTGPEPDQVRYFSRGLLTNIMNPKAGLFYLAVLPRFIEPSQPVIRQTLLLSLLYVLIATAIHATIVVLADAAGTFLADPRRRGLLRRTLSLALAVIALWLGWTTRSQT